MATPLAASRPSRRHRSRQRERLLDHLRRTTSHPTAAEIHAALQPGLPALALATVYRNLELLVAEGRVHEVPTVSGALRYDGRLEPHDHFECEHCGRLFDVQACAPARLARSLERRHGLIARRVRVAFVGRCGDCSAADAGPPAGPAGARSAAAVPLGMRNRATDPASATPTGVPTGVATHGATGRATALGADRSERAADRSVAPRSDGPRAPASRSRTGPHPARARVPRSTKEGSRWPI